MSKPDLVHMFRQCITSLEFAVRFDERIQERGFKLPSVRGLACAVRRNRSWDGEETSNDKTTLKTHCL